MYIDFCVEISRKFLTRGVLTKNFSLVIVMYIFSIEKQKKIITLHAIKINTQLPKFRKLNIFMDEPF